MSHDLATKSAATGSVTVRNMDDLARMGTMLANSGYFKDAHDAAQCGVKVLAGLEMGFGAFASMSGIHIIQGKPAIGANLMAAKVKASGKYDYRVRHLDDDSCTIEFFQGSESLGSETFTRDDAKRAGTQNMSKFPRNMLFARAMSNGVKFYTPDVFLGAPVYTAEELGAETDEDGNIVDVPSAPHKPAARAIAEPRLTAKDEDPFMSPAESFERAGEPPFVETSVPEEPLATAPQLKKLAISMKENDLTSREDALGFFSWLVKRPLASSKELTKSEASRVLGWDRDAWQNALADYAVSLLDEPEKEAAA